MVIDKPTFNQLWSEIFPYINDRVIVAHNASFDIGALLNVLDLYNIEYPSFKYLCTVKLSQKAYPDIESHKLNAIADFLGEDFSHHQAGDDAYVCAKLLIKIMKDFNLKTIQDLQNHFKIHIGKVYPGCHIPCLKNEKKSKKSK